MKKGSALLLSVLAASAALAADDMKAFPLPAAGMMRHVLELPKKAEESDFKVELIVGKTVSVDAVNRYFFGGEVASETIDGWGYTRYVVEKIGPMAGTRMAVPPGTPEVERFVPLGGGPFLIPYNSKLPVVVYVPEGAEVRYRIWAASAPAEVVPNG